MDHFAEVDRHLAGQVVVRFVGCLGEDPHLSASAVKPPLRDHRKNRSLSVFHRPYRSGSSRHTTAVWALNSMPWITRRLIPRGRPFAPETGSSGSMTCHCSSVSACLRMAKPRANRPAEPY